MPIPLHDPRPAAPGFLLDTNVLIDFVSQENKRPAVARLFELRESGWADLASADLLDAERIANQSPATVEQRLQETIGLVKFFGPSNDDQAPATSFEPSDAELVLIAQIESLLKPSGARPNTHRDAMHLFVAHKYGRRAFVTSDRSVLSRADSIHDLLAIDVLTPDAAVRRCESRKATHRRYVNARASQGSPDA